MIYQIKNCGRCNSCDIITNPFIVDCKNCGCQSFYDGVNNILTSKFILENFCIRVNYVENKTYLNKIIGIGDLILNFSIPQNIEKDRLKSYVLFS